MNTDLLSVLTTLPFIGWYAYRLHLLTELKSSGVPATAAIVQVIGGMAQYQYSAAGKTFKKQIRLDKVYGSKIKKGDALNITYTPSRPGFSCPAGGAAFSLKVTRRLLIGAIVLSVILSLPLILRPLI